MTRTQKVIDRYKDSVKSITDLGILAIPLNWYKGLFKDNPGYKGLFLNPLVQGLLTPVYLVIYPISVVFSALFLLVHSLVFPFLLLAAKIHDHRLQSALFGSERENIQDLANKKQTETPETYQTALLLMTQQMDQEVLIGLNNYYNAEYIPAELVPVVKDICVTSSRLHAAANRSAEQQSSLSNQHSHNFV